MNRLAHLNKRAASAKYKSIDILRILAIQDGNIIADVGAGGGFYTLEFAKAASPSGKVYAVDSNPENLTYVHNNAVEAGLDNVHTFATPEALLVLPEIKFDWIFMRNMFHHLLQPEMYFKSIADYLKPKGRVAVIDYKKTSGFSLRFFRLHHHYSDPDEIARVMQNAGLVLSQSYDFLSDQSFQIFSCP